MSPSLLPEPRRLNPTRRVIFSRFLLLASVLGLAAAGGPRALAIAADAPGAPRTEIQYLSGRGPADAIPWDFEVSAGRRAGEKITIPVPSNWEQHGFGTYNYGQDDHKADEHGRYRTQFHVPAAWRGRRINLVFDGAMTDTAVTLNGRPAGPVHQGGFTRFRYDITSLLKFGEDEANANVLEVDVAKVSADAKAELAERGGDYWVFGGIYRPVFLEALPARAIDQVAVDARADGTLAAEITLGAPAGGRTDGPNTPPQQLEAQVLDAAGAPVGAPLIRLVPAGGAGRVRLEGRVPGVEPWTAETPRLYTLRLTLSAAGKNLHTTDTRIGFRTFEVRDGEGLFLNGRRILLKGVNRHSFRPETARALTREDCYADVRKIRELNMNAVRMSHYPPDEAFLEACDELGLYVLDELPGWQRAHGTPVGRLLVRELVERDVNHPSILFWDNGNEGGWNPALDGDFSLYDPQRRRVLHPWNLHDGVDTKHYVPFDELSRLLKGPNLVMPTEVLHALYDGGGGAGLADYWQALAASPFGAGMFFWDFADEAISRTDRGGQLDAHSTYAPDGIVGPHLENEGSAYAIRDLWSPVQVTPPVLDARFSGAIALRNRYDFISLARCQFAWRLLRFDAGKETALAEGRTPAPDLAPQADGILQLALPADWRQAHALALTALGPDGGELWTSVWPTAAAAALQEKMLAPQTAAKTARSGATATRAGDRFVLAAGGTRAEFDAATGMLLGVNRAGKSIPLSGGPRLAFIRPATAAAPAWQDLTLPADGTVYLPQPGLANAIEVEFAKLEGSAAYAGFRLELSPDGQAWHTIFDASRRPGDGKRYTFPPQPVAAVRLTRLWSNRDTAPTLATFRLGYETARFPAAKPAQATVTHGVADGAAWLEAAGGPSGLARAKWTLRADGSLRLDYAYELQGEFLYHGVTFDLPEETMRSLHWWGQGPTRVWQNRLRGTWLGLHETRQAGQQAGVTWSYPEFAGYFAGVRWARLETAAGDLTIIPAQPDHYLRVGSPRADHPNTTVDFPAGDLSFLHAIPAIGTKFRPADKLGPQSQPAQAAGRYEGAIVFQLTAQP